MPTAITHDPVFTTPVSSTNTAVVRWSGTAGAVLQDSGVLIDGSNNLIIPAQGDLRLSDTTGGQYVALQAAGTTTTHTLTFPADNGAASTFLQNNGSGVLSWAAVSSAISREGGTTTEATTTSTSAMDLITISSLTIAAASPWTMTSLWRKTTGHASAASGGLKIVADSTVVVGESTTAATLWQSGTANLAEDGGSDTVVGATVTNYLTSNSQNDIVSRNSSSGGFTYGNVGTITKDAIFPVGQITSIVLRANSGNASVTTGSDEIHIYVLSVS